MIERHTKTKVLKYQLYFKKKLSYRITLLELLGQCIPVTRYRSDIWQIGSRSPPKFNHLFTGPLPTFPENFM